MKRSYLYITILGALFCMVSCKNTQKNHIEKETVHEIKVYQQAMKMDDELTAIHAMQSLIAWDSNQTKYYDTLAILFFHTQNYLGAVHCARQFLDKEPDKAEMLVVAGNSYQALHRFDLAIPVYSKLMQVKPNNILNYELAKCYYYNNDFGTTRR
jgi:tetratricopeptide (TPR) repeat protein